MNDIIYNTNVVLKCAIMISVIVQKGFKFGFFLQNLRWKDPPYFNIIYCRIQDLLEKTTHGQSHFLSSAPYSLDLAAPSYIPRPVTDKKGPVTTDRTAGPYSKIWPHHFYHIGRSITLTMKTPHDGSLSLSNMLLAVPNYIITVTVINVKDRSQIRILAVTWSTD